MTARLVLEKMHKFRWPASPFLAEIAALQGQFSVVNC